MAVSENPSLPPCWLGLQLHLENPQRERTSIAFDPVRYGRPTQPPGAAAPAVSLHEVPAIPTVAPCTNKHTLAAWVRRKSRAAWATLVHSLESFPPFTVPCRTGKNLRNSRMGYRMQKNIVQAQ